MSVAKQAGNKWLTARLNHVLNPRILAEPHRTAYSNLSPSLVRIISHVLEGWWDLLEKCSRSQHNLRAHENRVGDVCLEGKQMTVQIVPLRGCLRTTSSLCLFQVLSNKVANRHQMISGNSTGARRIALATSSAFAWGALLWGCVVQNVYSVIIHAS